MSGASFAERLVRLRERERLTAAQFAERFAIPLVEVEQLEAGEPPSAAMRVVAAVIEIDPVSVAAAAWWADEDEEI